MTPLEHHFGRFRSNTVGHEQTFFSPWGEQRIIYADWTASGRLYLPIEQALLERFGPFVGNTHSESSETGRAMTLAYHEAHRTLKAHANAGPDDLILTTGTGMTGVINKFQRILGLKAPQGLRRFIDIPEVERPVVFITHMEHHSNQTSWYETIADVVVVPPDAAGMVDLNALAALLHEYRERKVKIGSFSACSNVTGAVTPYHAMARLMHRAGGVAFIDFAASAPYVAIDMHPSDEEEQLDAVMWSPHKFLGGPGASGVLIFNRKLYCNTVPDDCGGGTVSWTNPWGQYSFLEDIEAREDAGTPGFLQTIKAALAVRLKDQMGVARMLEREQVVVPYVMDALQAIPGLRLLAPTMRHRLAIFSFYIEGIHYNLVVQLLNDRFGVQARGGCSCAGTYGHFLLHVDPSLSRSITDRIDHGDLSEKPGWVRISFHPSTTTADIDHTIHAVAEIVKNAAIWARDYEYSPVTNEFTRCAGEHSAALAQVKKWFELDPAAEH
jgi:selenocysteine lyase/cysteine desulfurase